MVMTMMTTTFGPALRQARSGPAESAHTMSLQFKKLKFMREFTSEKKAATLHQLFARPGRLRDYSQDYAQPVTDTAVTRPSEPTLQTGATTGQVRPGSHVLQPLEVLHNVLAWGAGALVRRSFSALQVASRFTPFRGPHRVFIQLSVTVFESGLGYTDLE